MPRLHMVRHGKAAAGFGESADPGLDALGKAQAEEVVRGSYDRWGLWRSCPARSRARAKPPPRWLNFGAANR